MAIVPRSAPWFGGFILSAVVAFGATSLWTPLVAFLGAAPSGVSDPVFGKDLSFYLLALPLYEEVIYLVITILVLTIAAWAGIGFLFYPRPGQPWRYHSRYPALMDERSPDGQARLFAAGRIAWEGWFRQGMVLGALFCLSFGLARFFARYHLIIGGHSAVVAGASFVDIHFWLPAYAVIIAGWVAAAMLLAAAACVPRLRRWLFAAPSHWVVPCAVFAALYVGAAIIPTAVEHLYVGPNQITLEQPYLIRSIAGTRQAMGSPGRTSKNRNSRFRQRRSAVTISIRTRQHCGMRASGTGVRSSPSCSRSRACDPITPLPASTSTGTGSMASSAK